MEWNPWETFEQELETLPITEPPCKMCFYFEPKRMYSGTIYDGVKICQANEMFNDFGCFKPRKANV